MGYDGYIEVYPKQDDNPDYVLQDHPEFMRLPAPFESVDFGIRITRISCTTPLLTTTSQGILNFGINGYRVAISKLRPLFASCWSRRAKARIIRMLILFVTN